MGVDSETSIFRYSPCLRLAVGPKCNFPTARLIKYASPETFVAPPNAARSYYSQAAGRV
jgi:hypothetical protein